MSLFKFCRNCENMLYLKRNDADDKLVYMCRNCGEVDNELKLNKCIYDIKYHRDDHIYKYFNNIHLANDPTLPRLKNIKCINPECVTNKFIHKYYVIVNIEDNEIDVFIQNLKENNPIVFKSDDDTDIIVGKVDNNHNNNYAFSLNIEDEKKHKENLEILRQYIKKNEIQLSGIRVANNDVIFIKYNHTNMKYLYMCTHCNTSWKNK